MTDPIRAGVRRWMAKLRRAGVAPMLGRTTGPAHAGYVPRGTFAAEDEAAIGHEAMVRKALENGDADMLEQLRSVVG